MCDQKKLKYHSFDDSSVLTKYQLQDVLIKALTKAYRKDSEFWKLRIFSGKLGMIPALKKTFVKVCIK